MKYKCFHTVYSSIELANEKSLLDNFLSIISMHLNIFFNNLIIGSLFDSKHSKWGQWTFCIFFPHRKKRWKRSLRLTRSFSVSSSVQRPHYSCKPVLGCLLVDTAAECAVRNKIFTVLWWLKKSVQNHLEERRENN